MSFLALKVALFQTVLISAWYAATANDHPCYRPCLAQQTMECVYNFTLENYYSMSEVCNSCPWNIDDCNGEDCIYTDGTKRSIMTVNRQLPGPKIEVCLGDDIVVHVSNQLLSDSAIIHWHGQHQRSTPYMDGVPFVTQCPIPPGDTFTYRFKATQVGTSFWHSHLGLQRGDGIYGPLIVRQTQESNQHADLYDYDLSSHVMVINDWTAEAGLDKFLSFIHSDGNNKPSSMLINGKGRYKKFTRGNAEEVYTPAERFIVDKGYRYRFRIVNNAALQCPIEMSIDNHTMTLIGSDGNDVIPIDIESLVSHSGERYDVIINADQEENLYWMKFRGLVDCDERFNSVYQVAVLQYSRASEDDYPDEEINYEHTHKDGLQVNSLHTGMETVNNSTLSVAHLRSIEELETSLRGTPDFKYVASLRVHGVGNPILGKRDAYDLAEGENSILKIGTPQINSITTKFPPSPLLFKNFTYTNTICNETTLANSNCDEEYCACTFVVQVPLNSLVELILVDTNAGIAHPIHLHGYSFRVIGMEYLGGVVDKNRILELDSNGLLKRNFDNPPLKDTVIVPGQGYTIIRFLASNPGYWFLHCHLEYHTALGMGLILKSGENHEMPPVPENFPECGNYD